MSDYVTACRCGLRLLGLLALPALAARELFEVVAVPIMLPAATALACLPTADKPNAL